MAAIPGDPGIGTQESCGGKAGKRSGCAAGGQDVAGAGQVIAGGLGRMIAQEDGAGMADAGQPEKSLSY